MNVPRQKGKRGTWNISFALNATNNLAVKDILCALGNHTVCYALTLCLLSIAIIVENRSVLIRARWVMIVSIGMLPTDAFHVAYVDPHFSVDPSYLDEALFTALFRAVKVNHQHQHNTLGLIHSRIRNNWTDNYFKVSYRRIQFLPQYLWSKAKHRLKNLERK